MQVFSIREAAANNLKRLAEEFGPEWAMQHIVPQVLLLEALIFYLCNFHFNVPSRLKPHFTVSIESLNYMQGNNQCATSIVLPVST